MENRRIIDENIIFNDPKSVFYAGQVLTGKINFELKTSMLISAIDINFLGEACVDWLEYRREIIDGVLNGMLLAHYNREEYFNHSQRLAQDPSIFPAGAYLIPFSFQIPFNIPSSLKEEKGEIKYTVTVNITYQDGEIKTKSFNTNFHLIAPLNLNTASSDARRPLVMEIEKTVQCQFFWERKHLSVRVRMPVQAYCPGETMLIFVNANNKTGAKITKIIFELIRRVKFRSRGTPPLVFVPPEKVIASMVKGPILGKIDAEYVFDMKVPDFIAVNLDCCNIIKVGYFFRVTMQLSRCNKNLTDESELFIGMVPFGSTADVRTTHPLANELPNAPIPDPNNPAELSPAYPAALIANQDIADTDPPEAVSYSLMANAAGDPTFDA